jgi:hypothetical protein
VARLPGNLRGAPGKWTPASHLASRLTRPRPSALRARPRRRYSPPIGRPPVVCTIPDTGSRARRPVPASRHTRCAGGRRAHDGTPPARSHRGNHRRRSRHRTARHGRRAAALLRDAWHRSRRRAPRRLRDRAPAGRSTRTPFTQFNSLESGSCWPRSPSTPALSSHPGRPPCHRRPSASRQPSSSCPKTSAKRYAWPRSAGTR